MLKRNFLLVALIVGILYAHSAVFAADFDSDGDGLSDADEVARYRSDPSKADTDGDGYNDGDEIENGYTPLYGDHKRLDDIDTDDDGLNDAQEIDLGTNLVNADTDGDGYKDGVEAHTGFNPLKGDRDRSMPRTVAVDLNTQQLTYAIGGVKLGSMPVSTGKLSTPTPTGTFSVFAKKPVVHYVGPGYNLPNTKWNLEFKRGYYLHGAYWHNQFGIRPMSHGCVNIAYKDVEKLYNFMDIGDPVTISGKTPAKVNIAKK